jgi:hypothetical protein
MILKLEMPIPLAWLVCALFGAGVGMTAAYFKKRKP